MCKTFIFDSFKIRKGKKMDTVELFLAQIRQLNWAIVSSFSRFFFVIDTSDSTTLFLPYKKQTPKHYSEILWLKFLITVMYLLVVGRLQN